MSDDVMTADVHPLLHGYDRHRIIATVDLGDAGANVMEWRPASTVPSNVVPTQLFTLQWTDFVATDWCEVYESLSQALARLSLLSACQESGWDVGFQDDERWWGHRWSKFVKEATV